MATLPLDDTPETAYRLLVGSDDFCLVGEFLSLWGMLSGTRRTFQDIPTHWKRLDGMLTAPGSLEPLVLKETEAVAEAFRLSERHNPVGRNGWHLHSNVVRAGRLLTRYHELPGMDGKPVSFASFVRQVPYVEGLLDARDILYVRPRDPDLKVIDGKVEKVVTWVIAHPETEERDIGESSTFTEARQALLAMQTALVSNRTRVVMRKGDQRLVAVFDSATRSWRCEDGSRLGGIHPGEPPRHSYRNGEFVGTRIGYVTVTRRGRVHATVGRPIHSSGDDDASVALIERLEALDVGDAIAKLEARGDLDHVFTLPITVDAMGVWLTCLRDEESVS